MTEGNNKICVIGIWHLGSVVSACLADLGYQIVGVDKDADRMIIHGFIFFGVGRGQIA